MSANHTIQSLHDRGFSYVVLAETSGSSVPKIRQARTDDTVLEQEAQSMLERLDAIISPLDIFIKGVDPVAQFEEQIIRGKNKETGKIEWAYLRRLWTEGYLTDEEVYSVLKCGHPLYSLQELFKDYPPEYKVVDAADGHKAIVPEILIEKARNLENFSFC